MTPPLASIEARQEASEAKPPPITVPEPTEAVEALQAVAGVVSPTDRTLAQVNAQLAAFGADLYEVQPLPPKGVELAKERIRRWTADQVVKGLGWLRRMNAIGYDIFIRPAAPAEGLAHPFAFVDDVDQATVDRMRGDGLPFAVLNESSVGRFHGWVRLAEAPLPRDAVTAAGRVLAATYGADPASVDWRHYGRLAGTTNRKPSRAGPKGPPFVMLRTTSTDVPAGAAHVMAQARAALDQAQHERVQAAQEARSATSFHGDHSALGDAAAAFQGARAGVVTTRPGDESARDYGAALSLLRRGFTTDQVVAAMLAASPDLAARKTDPEGYTRRTVENAAARVGSTPSVARKPG